MGQKEEPHASQSSDSSGSDSASDQHARRRRLARGQQAFSMQQPHWHPAGFDQPGSAEACSPHGPQVGLPGCPCPNYDPQLSGGAAWLGSQYPMPGSFEQPQQMMHGPPDQLQMPLDGAPFIRNSTQMSFNPAQSHTTLHMVPTGPPGLPPLSPLPLLLLPAGQPSFTQHHSPTASYHPHQPVQGLFTGNQPADGLLFDASTGQVLQLMGVEGTMLLQELHAAGHLVQPLAEAHVGRIAALQTACNGPLLERRSRLLKMHAHLAMRAGEVRATAASHARQAADVVQGMLERLAAAEAQKLSQLGSQQAAVAAEVWALEGLVARVCEVSQEGGASLGGPVEFMAASSLLLQECDHFGQKALPLEPALEDLPHEASSLATLKETHAALVKLVGVKDAMIWQLLKQREELGKHSQELAQALAEVMQEPQRCH